jgi:hypothetical protein
LVDILFKPAARNPWKWEGRKDGNLHEIHLSDALKLQKKTPDEYLLEILVAIMLQLLSLTR